MWVLRVLCVLALFEMLFSKILNSSSLQMLLQLLLGKVHFWGYLYTREKWISFPVMLLLLKIQNHWGSSVCCFIHDIAVVFCKLMNAKLELLKWERWGHLAPLHWSLLFAVRSVCIELHWCLCWRVAWIFAFDLALEDPACLPPDPGFWGNLLTTDTDDVEKTL